MMALEPLVELRRNVGAINVSWISSEGHGEDGLRRLLHVDRSFRPSKASSLIVNQDLHVASQCLYNTLRLFLRAKTVKDLQVRMSIKST